jgi:hypothetical protein
MATFLAHEGGYDQSHAESVGAPVGSRALTHRRFRKLDENEKEPVLDIPRLTRKKAARITGD